MAHSEKIDRKRVKKDIADILESVDFNSVILCTEKNVYGAGTRFEQIALFGAIAQSLISRGIEYKDLLDVMKLAKNEEVYSETKKADKQSKTKEEKMLNELEELKEILKKMNGER